MEPVKGPRRLHPSDAADELRAAMKVDTRDWKVGDTAIEAVTDDGSSYVIFDDGAVFADGITGQLVGAVNGIAGGLRPNEVLVGLCIEFTCDEGVGTTPPVTTISPVSGGVDDGLSMDALFDVIGTTDPVTDADNV